MERDLERYQTKQPLYNGIYLALIEYFYKGYNGVCRIVCAKDTSNRDIKMRVSQKTKIKAHESIEVKRIDFDHLIGFKNGY